MTESTDTTVIFGVKQIIPQNMSKPMFLLTVRKKHETYIYNHKRLFEPLNALSASNTF